MKKIKLSPQKIPLSGSSDGGAFAGRISESEFQRRYKKKTKQAGKIKHELSWQERAKKFLDSDSAGCQATKVALGLIVVAGALTVFSVMPGLTIVAGRYKRAQYYSKKQLYDARENLKKCGYIETDRIHDKPRVRLTKKGEEYFQKMIFEEARLSSQSEWDGKWRFVLFDIPLGHTKARDALRWRLRALGFFQYQKSVWVYPYPCKDEVLFVADHFGVGRFVEVLEVTELTNDKNLKKHFELQ